MPKISFIFKYLLASQLVLSTAFALGVAPSPKVPPFRHGPGFRANPAYFKGDVHTIWFSLDGSVPEHAIRNLKEWNQAILEQGSSLDYKVHLWTFKYRINAVLLNDLEAAGIIVHNIAEIAQEDAELNLYLFKLTDYALKQQQWYRSAFAVMSDMLRIHIMGQAPQDRFYIYVDINDTTFYRLVESLRDIGSRAQSNYAPFDVWKGFAFPRLDGNFTFNNDLIIARREGHEAEIDEFRVAYMKYVGARLENYMKKAHVQWETCPGDVARLVFSTSHADRIVSRYAGFVPDAAQLIAYKHAGANTWLRKKEERQMHSSVSVQPSTKRAAYSEAANKYSAAKRVARHR